MARRRNPTASRDAGFIRLLLWLTLCGAGIAGGFLLGGLAVGTGLGGAHEREASYADLSANPRALAVDSLPPPGCLDCPDSYGVAARLRTIRNERSDDAFRELGAVELDYAPAQEADDDYQYGGRFPEADFPELNRPPVTEQPEDVPDSLPADHAGTNEAPPASSLPAAAAPDD
ncbi:hypothetical protein [Sphingopyxis panaciterrae]